MNDQYAEYVRGKTVAVVGPAPAPHDQAAEVDAHDIVIRCSYGFVGNRAFKERAKLDWISGIVPDGYGTRVDVAYYNSLGARVAFEGRLDAVLPDLDWALWKVVQKHPPNRGLCQEREAYRPRRKGKDINVNQVTGILWDLHHFEPADVTVFGADFYTSPFQQWYDPKYAQRQILEDVGAHVKAARIHDQEAQRSVVRTVLERKGWPTGDDRYLNALHMTREEHEALMDQIAQDARPADWMDNTTPDALVT